MYVCMYVCMFVCLYVLLLLLPAHPIAWCHSTATAAFLRCAVVGERLPVVAVVCSAHRAKLWHMASIQQSVALFVLLLLLLLLLCRNVSCLGWVLIRS
jgi:hypothetical protein